jgi:hypothetical protein
LLEPACSGHSATHIISMMSEPAPAATRVPMPSMTAAPTPSMPSMNSTSVTGLAIEWKKSANGPITAGLFRKPWLGAPPLIQARSDGVE